MHGAQRKIHIVCHVFNERNIFRRKRALACIKYLEPAAVSLSALCLLTKARSGRGRIKRQIHQLEIRLCRIGFYEALIFQILRVGKKTALLRRREYAKPRFALFAAVADTFVEQVV